MHRHTTRVHCQGMPHRVGDLDVSAIMVGGIQAYRNTDIRPQDLVGKRFITTPGPGKILLTCYLLTQFGSMYLESLQVAINCGVNAPLRCARKPALTFNMTCDMRAAMTPAFC